MNVVTPSTTVDGTIGPDAVHLLAIKEVCYVFLLVTPYMGNLNGNFSCIYVLNCALVFSVIIYFRCILLEVYQYQYACLMIIKSYLLPPISGFLVFSMYFLTLSKYQLIVWCICFNDNDDRTNVSFIRQHMKLFFFFWQIVKFMLAASTDVRTEYPTEFCMLIKWKFLIVTSVKRVKKWFDKIMEWSVLQHWLMLDNMFEKTCLLFPFCAWHEDLVS